MPEEAPVMSAVPGLEVFLTFMDSLRFSSGRPLSDRTSPSPPMLRRSCACLKCRICNLLGHTGFIQIIGIKAMQRIGFVIFPGLQAMGIAAITAFEVANLIAGEDVYGVELLSEHGGLVRASAGFSIDTKAFKG